MNAREPFSDATLERMLVRRSERAEPGDLRESVFAGIEAIEPRRSLWPVGWRVPTLVGASRLQPLPAAVALLLLALLAATLAAGAAWLRQREARIIELTPTAIEVMTPGDLAWTRVVEDGNGTLWALGTGEVTRFDPASGEHRTWTIADDAAFDTFLMSPARQGGVWLWSGERMLRFTGDAFAEAIPAPGVAGPFDEAPDGTLWAVTASDELIHWDGAQWLVQSAPELPPDQRISALLADSRGGLWTASYGGGAPASLAHLEGSRWSVVDWTAGSTGPAASLSEGVDGAIWMTLSDSVRMGRLDDGRWTYVDAPGGSRLGQLSVADDGSIWTTFQGIEVGRYAAGRWTTFGPSDGITGSTIGTVSATSAGVFVGTDQGLLRYDRGHWAPMWSPAVAPDEFLGGMHAFIGVSRDEAWLGGMRGVWRFHDGAWLGPIEPPGLAGGQVTGLALADDGTLWVATTEGVAVFADDRWSVAWHDKALSIDLAADGSAWVGDFGRITHLTPTASGFRSESVNCPMPAITLTVAADDTLWVGGFSYSGKAGLAHFDGTTCSEVDLRSDPSANTTVEVGSIVADPAGGVFIHAMEGLYDPSTGSYDQPPTESVTRLSNGVRTVVATSTGTNDSSFGAITVAPNGELWWARGRISATESDPTATPAAGLARFDGERWIQVLAGIEARGPVSVTADGTVWFQGASGTMRYLTTGTPSP
jgi:hypothetical protein